MSDDGFKGTWASEDDDEKREPFFWWGFVSNNQDPENRGRVKINIPGLNNVESTWAEQCGGPGSGGGKHGFWSVPKVGSVVLVGFILGDIDAPFYIPGPTPDGEQPGNAKPENQVIESDNFRLSFIETKGQEKVRLETLVPGVDPTKLAQVQSVIEMSISNGSSGTSHVITIKAPSGITINSSGSIAIDAAVITIKGRTVMPSTEPI